MPKFTDGNKTLMETMKDHEKAFMETMTENHKNAIVEEKRPSMKNENLKISFKSKKKVKDMTKKQKETIPQVIEENETQIAQELAISSKNVKQKKKEVKSVTQTKKATHKKQRKGKSLLTAFRINRMGKRDTLFSDNGKRLVLNMNRGQFEGKYA
jgi:hypothetical protein